MAILAISREYGSGGREIGRRLAQRLNYAYVDKECLFLDLDRVGKRWGQAARDLDEVCPTFWERHDWQYHGYITQLESLILDYAAADKVVIIGRGAFLLLREVPFCLKARLVAPLEVRLERIMVSESLVREEAEELIARVDQERACYLQANYEKAWDEEGSYDCVLNTGTLTYDQVVELLIEGLAEKELLATPEAKARLADLALAARVKARLATDPRVLAPTLKVFWDDGTIVVSGVIHTLKELHLVQEIVHEVVGTRLIRFDLHHRT
jgi:cytidylate kinase